MKNLNKNSGSAILTALFIMIIVAIAATAMSLRLQIDINRTQLIIDVDKLKSLAEQGRLIVIKKLIDNAHNYSAKKKQNIDSLTNVINENLDNNITRKIILKDLQSIFNLNNLSNRNLLKPFALLISRTIPKINNQKSLNYALLTKEWISKPTIKNAALNSTSYYNSLKPAYSPSHKPFISVSEFRLVKDISQRTFNSLLPIITALPEQTPININTAPLSILMTLGAGLTKSQANSIINLRGKNGFTTIEKALAKPQIKNLNINSKQVTLTSKFFLITTEIKSSTSQLILFSIVKREISKKGIELEVIQETINTI